MREILARMSSLTLALKPSVSLMAQTSGEFLISISLSVQYLSSFSQSRLITSRVLLQQHGGRCRGLRPAIEGEDTEASRESSGYEENPDR